MEKASKKTSRSKSPPRIKAPEKQKVSEEETKSETQAEFVIEIGSPKLSRFERARIIGARALQLSLGAPAFVPIGPGERDPIALATRELESKGLPISIRRILPDGRFQDIPIHFLL